MAKLVEEFNVEDAGNFCLVVYGKLFIGVHCRLMMLFFSVDSFFIVSSTGGKFSTDYLVGGNGLVALRIGSHKLGQLVIPANVLKMDKVKWRTYFCISVFNNFCVFVFSGILC